MNKTWLIVKHEYTRHVFRWRFLLMLIGFPLMFVGLFGIGLLGLSLQYDRSPVGYVDLAKIITVDTLPAEYNNPLFGVKLLPYPSEAAAREALDKKIIQAFFVLPADYRKSLHARLVYFQKPLAIVNIQFNQIMRLNLMAGQPKIVTQRVMEGSQTVVVTTVEKQRESSSNSLFRSALPFAMSYILFLSVTTSSGYLIKAVVEEKENRTMELLATSVSPSSIMVGKILGLVSVGLTQMLVWCGPALLIAVFIAAFYPPFQGMVSWNSVLLMLVTAVPTFLLISTLIAVISITFGEAREGQMFTGLVMMPTSLPFALIIPLGANPSGPLAIFMSLFPLTAANTLLIRMAFATVPAWQILACVGLLILCCVGAFWLSGRMFRKWMLRYGKPFEWRGFFRGVFPVLFKNKKGTA